MREMTEEEDDKIIKLYNVDMLDIMEISKINKQLLLYLFICICIYL